MNIENENLVSIVKKTDSKLKELVVNHVGETLNPKEDEITVKQVIEVFSEEFPEFVLAIAEENWINGYTQALKDVEFHESSNSQNEKLSN